MKKDNRRGIILFVVNAYGTYSPLELVLGILILLLLLLYDSGMIFVLLAVFMMGNYTVLTSTISFLGNTKPGMSWVEQAMRYP